MLSPVQIRSFITAVAEGSLSAAARKLGLTQPAVSQHLAQLEAATGRALVIRSSRGVTPTAAGDIVLRHGRRILREYADLTNDLDILSGEVSGQITVSTNVLFNRMLMLPIFARVVEDYPGLALKLAPTDAFIDLERDGVDIALRTGEPGDGPGVVRRIADIDMALVATPQYVAKAGEPKAACDLRGLNYIQFRDDPGQTHLELLFDGVSVDIPVTPAFGAQSSDLLMHAVATHLGFARLPRFVIGAELAAGELVELLPDTPSAPKPIYLVQHAHEVGQARNKVLRHLIFDTLRRLDLVALAASAEAEYKAGLDPILSTS